MQCASHYQKLEIMRTVLIIISFICYAATAQNVSERRRFIEVKGSSELEITPDEIFVAITLKEYKKGGSKVSLDDLESGLIKAMRKLSIPEDQLRVQNVFGYNWNWRKRRTDDFMGSKNFVLEVGDLKKMNDLVELLDSEGLNNMNVQSFSRVKGSPY